MYKNIISHSLSLLLLSGGVSTIVNATDIASPAKVQATSLPRVELDDTDNSTDTDGREWAMYGTPSSFYIKDDVDDGVHNYITVFEVAHSTNNENSFLVDTAGDINLADGSVFIDRSLNYMGIGTSTPAYPLHIVSTGENPDILLEYSGGSVKWRMDPGGDGFWIRDEAAGTDPLTIQNGAPDWSLRIDNDGNIGIGRLAPQARLDVSGTIKNNDTITSEWSGSSSSGLKSLVALSANNSGGNSDVGFSMENKVDSFTWTFRTYSPAEGFAASKLGTGGPEFEVQNTGTDLSTTVVKMGGVVVFKNGHLVNTSGQELTSLINEQSKLLAETRAALKTKDEKIALLEKQQKEQSLKIAQLETMRQKVAMMESILTNLALDTANSKKEKVSLNSK